MRIITAQGDKKKEKKTGFALLIMFDYYRAGARRSQGKEW
jgi:hypothetical protein